MAIGIGSADLAKPPVSALIEFSDPTPTACPESRGPLKGASAGFAGLARAFAERLVRTVRTPCLNWLLIRNEPALCSRLSAGLLKVGPAGEESRELDRPRLRAGKIPRGAYWLHSWERQVARNGFPVPPLQKRRRLSR
jgi:hypothetical protein